MVCEEGKGSWELTWKLTDSVSVPCLNGVARLVSKAFPDENVILRRLIGRCHA